MGAGRGDSCSPTYILEVKGTLPKFFSTVEGSEEVQIKNDVTERVKAKRTLKPRYLYHF